LGRSSGLLKAPPQESFKGDLGQKKPRNFWTLSLNGREPFRTNSGAPISQWHLDPGVEFLYIGRLFFHPRADCFPRRNIFPNWDRPTPKEGFLYFHPQVSHTKVSFSTLERPQPQRRVSWFHKGETFPHFTLFGTGNSLLKTGFLGHWGGESTGSPIWGVCGNLGPSFNTGGRFSTKKKFPMPLPIKSGIPEGIYHENGHLPEGILAGKVSLPEVFSI